MRENAAGHTHWVMASAVYVPSQTLRGIEFVWRGQFG